MVVMKKIMKLEEGSKLARKFVEALTTLTRVSISFEVQFIDS